MPSWPWGLVSVAFGLVLGLVCKAARLGGLKTVVFCSFVDANTWHLVLGTDYWVPSTWYSVIGIQYFVLSTYNLAQSAWYIILATWHLVLGT